MNYQAGSFCLLILICFFTPTTVGQTTRERSDKAYAALRLSKGQKKVRLLNELTTYRITDTIDKAGTFAAMAVHESEKLGNEPALAKSLVLQGTVFLAKQMADSALVVLNRAGAIYKDYPRSDGIALYYLNIGKILFIQKKLKEAERMFAKAIELNTQSSDYYLTGCAFLGIADCKKLVKNKPDYLSNLNRAEEQFHRCSDRILISSVLVNVGIRYLDLSMSEKANKQFYKAVRLLEQSADSLVLGYTLINISAIRVMAARGKSNDYYLRGLAIFRALKNDKAIAYALNQKGMEYFSNKEYKKALPLYIEAACLKEKATDWQGASFVYGNLVEIYVKQKRTKEATAALLKCREMVSKAGDKLSRTVLLQSEGNYYRALKMYDKAIEKYKNSITFSQEMQITSIVSDNLKFLSETYQAKGDAVHALEYYKIFTDYKDSLENTSNLANIADVQLKYETERKDRLIRGLINSTIRSGKNNYYIVGNVIAFILVILLAVAYFFRFRKPQYLHLQRMFTSGGQLQQKYNEQSQIQDSAAFDKVSKTLMTREQQELLWEQLKNLLETEKLFLQNDLSLTELARRLNTNTTYLSKVINSITCQNFSQLLNQYRVDEACILLSGPKGRNMTIEGIAQSSGFNSKSAFNTAFKKFKSTTPSEYIAMKNEKIEQFTSVDY